MRIIISHNKEEFTRLLAAQLTESGFEVVSRDPDDIGPGDIVIMFEAGGAELRKHVAALAMRQPDAFIVVIANCDNLADRLSCYDAGADECIFRPFHFSELVAKLRALERRKAPSAEVALLGTSVTTIDPTALELRAEGRVQSLTKRESKLLIALARANGEAVGREHILREAWEAPDRMTNNSVDVYVGYARRKLALVKADVDIFAMRGVGFRLAVLPYLKRANDSVK